MVFVSTVLLAYAGVNLALMPVVAYARWKMRHMVGRADRRHARNAIEAIDSVNPDTVEIAQQFQPRVLALPGGGDCPLIDVRTGENVPEWEDADTVQDRPISWPRPRRALAIASSVSREARAKFLLMQEPFTRAMNLVVHKWMYDRVMSLKDIRKADVPNIMSYAMELVWLADQGEIVIRRLTATREAAERRSAGRAAWWDWSGGAIPQPAASG